VAQDRARLEFPDVPVCSDINDQVADAADECPRLHRTKRWLEDSFLSSDGMRGL
jgi:hypothetical protein